MSQVEEDLNNLFHNPYESTRTAILNLDDECILEIFSRLPLLMLCNVRDTCQRLRTLADFYFATMHKSLNFGCRSIKGPQFKLFTQDETKSILSSFGHHIEALIIHADLFAAKPDEVLQTLNDFCDNRRLCHLKLIKFAFDETIIDSCDRLFANVEKLTIDKCFADDEIFEKLFRKCTSMRYLELMRQFNIDGRCLAHTYPMLDGFSLISNNNFDPRLVNSFMAKNPQLKVLKMIGCNFVDDEIFETIADNLVLLESLSIRMVHVTSNFETNLMNLLRLQHLRELEFNCGVQPIESFVNGLAMTNRIEAFGISSAELTGELCAAICNLKNLQLLKLISIFDTQQSRSITSIAIQLTQLKELHVVECEPITFDEMVEFIERAPRLEKLVINQCCNMVPFNGSQFIQLADACQKRINKLHLIIHLDYDELCTTKRQVSSDLRREYAHIVQLVQLSWEDTDYCVSDAQCRYFAEEGGVYEYDLRDSNRCKAIDDYDFNDPYNVWNDDFDDEDLYPF